MASQYNNSSLKQGLGWIIGLMLKFGRSLSQRSERHAWQFNSNKLICWRWSQPRQTKGAVDHCPVWFWKKHSHSELRLVPLEATIAASQEVACVLKCHHCAACTYCAVVILSPLWGYLAVDCMITTLAGEPSLDFYTVVCTQFVVQTDTLKPFSSLTLVT